MRARTTTTIAAAALLLAACGSPDETNGSEAAPDGQQEPTTTEEAGTPEETDEAPEAAEPDAEDPTAALPDPADMIEDGTFRGAGITLPAPDGWQFDEMALSQGLVIASDESGLQQVAGQAIDVDELPEPLTFEELLESNRAQFPDEPELDENVEIDGAVEARQLRYDTLPARDEGQPETSLLMIVADNGDGRLAVFNYAATSDEYEDANAEQLVRAAGFDPDSAPIPPQLPEIEPAPSG